MMGLTNLQLPYISSYQTLRTHLTPILLIFTLLVLILSPCYTADVSKAASGEKMQYISVNNGPFEDDQKRLVETNLINKMFQERYPGWAIKPDTWQYSPETFIPKVQAGTCTDVVGLFATEGSMVIQKGLALDLTDFINKWELGKYLIPEIIKPYSRQGCIYGIPVGGIGGAYVMNLFYNKKIFKEAGIVDKNGNPDPPDTWDEFVEVAQKLTDKTKGRAGFGILGDAAGGAGWHFLNWAWQAGGDFEVQNPDGTWKSVFGEPPVVKALQFIKDLRWKHGVLQSNVTCNNDDLFELFVSERIAMALFTPEYLTYLVEKLEMPLDDIGISLLPAGPAGRVNQMGGSFSIIVKNLTPEKQQMAFNTIVFDYDLKLIEERCKLLKSQGRLIGVPCLPVFTPEYQNKVDAILDKYRNLPSSSDLMREAAKYVRSEPPYYCQQLYSNFLSPAVQKVLTDKGAEPEKILKTASEQFQRQYLDKLNRELMEKK